MEHWLEWPRRGLSILPLRSSHAHGLLTAGCVLLLFLCGSFSARAGDPELARFLLEGGKKAVKSRDYEEGISRLEKALAEDPNIIEAHYWIGYAQEKRDYPEGAVAAYRAFRDACTGCESDLERGLSGLLRKTRARLRVLAAAEIELAELNADFIHEAVALAKGCFLRDPALAEHVVHDVLALDPENADALKLKAKLSQEGPSEDSKTNSGEGPTHDVVEWDDLLKRSFFSKNRGWIYANGMIEIDDHRGHFVSAPSPYPTPRSFVYEIEARVLEAYGAWGLGLMFDRHGQDWIACHMTKGALFLWRVKGAKDKEDLVCQPIEPIELDTWHRLSVAVTDNLIEVYLDGEKKVSHAIRSVDVLTGDIGTFHENNHCEIRVLRLGRRK